MFLTNRGWLASVADIVRASKNPTHRKSRLAPTFSACGVAQHFDGVPLLASAFPKGSWEMDTYLHESLFESVSRRQPLSERGSFLRAEC